MEKQILKNESRTSRQQILADSCVRKENFTYQQQFVSAELAFKKDELTQLCLKLSKLQEEKKTLVSKFNSNIKVAKAKQSIVLNSLRTGTEEVSEEVYLLDDQDEGKMGYYNKQGQLVYERLLMPEEKQLRILKQVTGTEN